MCKKNILKKQHREKQKINLFLSAITAHKKTGHCRFGHIYCFLHAGHLDYRKQPLKVFCKYNPEAAAHRCSSKLLLLKISQYFLESTCAGVFFKLQHRCFAVNIVKCLRTTILKNICWQMLLDYFSHKISSLQITLSHFNFLSVCKTLKFPLKSKFKSMRIVLSAFVMCV